jgi:signal peptidase II
MGLWGILLVVCAVVGADRITKLAAVRRLATDQAGVRGLRLVVNDRLPLAAGVSPQVLIVTWIAALLCALALVGFSPAARASPQVMVGLAVTLAGAGSNLADRLTRGSVVDFIDVGWWPVFNLADVAIVAGGFVAVFSLV